MAIKKVVILGAGVLGCQIAFHSAYKGMDVKVWNRHVDKAQQRLAALQPAYQADMGLAKADFEKILGQIEITSDLKEAVAGADLAIEAISENLEIKASFYHDLMAVVEPQTIIASNSSTFMPSQLVQYVGEPARFLHLHFANRIWKYNVAEISGTKATAPETIAAVTDFATAIGMVPIKMKKEYPGYVLNGMLVPFLTAGMTLWATGVADPKDIDRDWTISTGSPMGPFQILDMVGLRTAYQITMNNYEQTHSEVSKTVADKLKAMIDEGRIGVESGKGFYEYK